MYCLPWTLVEIKEGRKIRREWQKEKPPKNNIPFARRAYYHPEDWRYVNIESEGGFLITSDEPHVIEEKYRDGITTRKEKILVESDDGEIFYLVLVIREGIWSGWNKNDGGFLLYNKEPIPDPVLYFAQVGNNGKLYKNDITRVIGSFRVERCRELKWPTKKLLEMLKDLKISYPLKKSSDEIVKEFLQREREIDERMRV